METEDASKKRVELQTISRKGKGYASLGLGILTWMLIVGVANGQVPLIFMLMVCIMSSVWGIAFGFTAIQSNERLVALIGTVLCFGFYVFIIAFFASFVVYDMPLNNAD